MPIKTRVLIALLFLLGIAFSCDSNLVFEDYKTLPNSWHKDEVLMFDFEAPDTTSSYNLHVKLRNNTDYSFSNLYLITNLEYPNGKTYIDTLEYKMAAPDGTLLGEGFSDVKENKLWYKGYKKPFVFSELGNYTFRVQHAMRAYGQVNGLENLEGVTEVGFRVEKK